MKTNGKLTLIIISSLLLVVFVSGCTSNSKSYNGTVYSFNYPDDWNVTWESNTSNYNGTTILLNQNNGSQDAKITMTEIETNNSLNNYMNYFVDLYSQAYTNKENGTLAPYTNYQLISNQTLNINGLNGFDMLFKTSQTGLSTDLPIYIEEVVLQKENKFYELRLEYAPNVTSPYAHDDFMVMVNSLKIN
ncbi:MAG TPA: PsbP-related protein [Methanobacterium sp.]|nr:PsbP-related protein [Methanobacterium sp.]